FLLRAAHGDHRVTHSFPTRRSSDLKVAIKLLRGELSRDEHGRTRMLREAQALARLSHPNVVQVHEVGQWTDHDYVAMEYVDGRRSEEHTSELQSRENLVCRLLLEKK